MKICSINSIKSSNYNLLLKQESNNISFGEKRIGDAVLFNESEEINIRIKQFLWNSKEKKQQVRYKDLSNVIGLSEHAIKSRVSATPELKELWENSIHRQSAKRTKPIVINRINNPDEIELISKIQTILLDAAKKGLPLTYEDIASEIGVTRFILYRRIKSNPELLKLWQQCTHKKRPVKYLNDRKILQHYLTECIRKSEIITKNELSKQSNVQISSVNYHLLHDKELNTLWQILQQVKTDNNSDIRQKIKNILLSKKERNISIKIDDVAKQSGLDIRACRHIIDNDAELSELWKSLTHKRGKLSNKEESKIVNEKIKCILEDANKNGTSIRSEDLAKTIGVSHRTCYNRLIRYPELNVLWRENNSILSNNFKYENNKIKSELKNLITTKKTASISEIAQRVELPEEIFKDKIYKNSEIKSLWELYQTTIQENIIQTIKDAIIKAIEKDEQITYETIETEHNISKNVLKKRLKENPELKELWQRAKHYELTQQNHGKKEYKPTKIYELIKSKLDNISKEGRIVYMYDIAEELGMTPHACSEYIARKPELKALWKQIQKTISDDSRDVYNKIYNILQEALEQNESLSIEEIAKRAKISKEACYGRLHTNGAILDLWNKVSENRENLIKQITLLKIQKIPNEQIQKKLVLNKKLFNELLTEFNKIKSLISIHESSDISKEDYLKWATLTKREFELAITKLFEKMGYKAGATRYIIDGGVDVVASKEGKKTFIECVHNLDKPVMGQEVLALQGCKYYFGADNVILVASSGVFKNAKNLISKINQNNGNKFKVLELEDVIRLSKKYNMDVSDLKNVPEINHKQTNEIERKRWFFKKLECVSDEERIEWKNLSVEELISKVKEIFSKQNYKIKPITDESMKNGYLIEKDGVRSILQYIGFSARNIDEIRSLFGAKDVFGVKNVIMYGLDSLTFASQDFINTINKKCGKECNFKVLSLDKIIKLSKKV